MLMAGLAACTGSTNYWNAYRPVSGTTSNANAVQAAVVAITDAGKEVESSDNGIVLSKWFSGDGFGGDQNRFRVRVTVNANAYEVAALCQAKKPGSGGAWSEECDATKRPQFVLDVVARIEAGLR